MRKLLTLSVLLISLNAFCQDAAEPDRRSFATATGGLALPFSDYSDISKKNAYAGYASTGFNFEVFAGIRLKKLKTIGFCTQLNSYSNGVAGSFLLKNIATDQSLSYRLTVSDNYRGLNFLVGGFASLPVKRSAIEFGALVGFCTSSIPALTVQVTDGSNTAIIGTTDGSTTSFSYGSFVSWRFPLGDKLCGNVKASFFSTSPTYAARLESFTIDSNGNWEATSVPTNIKQPVSNIFINAGLGWRFGR